MERSEKEVNEYYQPKDFRVGDTIFVYGRRFILLNCDDFTRKYFQDVLKEPQTNKLDIKFPTEPLRKRVNGFRLQNVNCFNNRFFCLRMFRNTLVWVHRKILWLLALTYCQKHQERTLFATS